MTKNQIAAINRELRNVNPQYRARFVEAEDCSVDDEITIDCCGQETGWHLQIGCGYVGVNRMVGDGGDAVLHGFGFYRTTGQAVIALCNLLRQNTVA